MIPFPDVPYVTGTVKHCKLNNCTEPAKHAGLCTAHAARRTIYTLLQLGGLVALTAASFLLATWLGLAMVGLSLLLVGLVVENG